MQSKKIFSVFLAMILTVSFISCTQTDATGEITSETDSQITENESENTSNGGTVSGFGNNLVDGTNVIEDRFDDNTPGLWGTYANGGDFELYAENGEIVVALLNDEATVKRFFKENGQFRLQPENDAYEPIICAEVIILGKLVSLIRYY